MEAFARQVDVLVCGGGVAGVSAAIAAARAGMKTALVEKTVFPGGLATSGLINVYLPLCDGCGRQVTFGLAEELLHLSMRYGPGVVPPWAGSRGAKGQPRYRVTFSPASFVLALDEALEEAGVELWLDTLACVPVMEGRRVAGVEMEAKEGRGRILAGCTIDATGDADVAFRAGVPCAEERNAGAMWAIEFDDRAASASGLDGKDSGRIAMVRFGKHSREDGDRSEARADSAREVTRFALEGRRLLRDHYRKLYAAQDEAARLERFPVTLPAMAQFRTTRRIAGQALLSDGQHACRREDSIGLVAD